MMKRVMQVLMALCLCAPTTVWANQGGAGDSDEEGGLNLRLGMGARIGGYGFREVRDSKVNWNDCRMDGFGLFGTLDLTQHFFLETSVEMYHAIGKSVAMGMDRTSFHTAVAGGARFLPNFIVSPYVQAGVGPEYAQIKVGEAERSMFLANAFMGVGGELNLGDLKLGMHLRWLWAGLPEHDHLHEAGSVHQHLNGAEGGDEVVVNYAVAGQAQFFVRYVF